MFEDWIDGGARQLVAGGVRPTQARRVIIELLAALEGAFILCRAAQNTEALQITGEAAAASVSSALESRLR